MSEIARASFWFFVAAAAVFALIGIVERITGLPHDGTDTASVHAMVAALLSAELARFWKKEEVKK